MNILVSTMGKHLEVGVRLIEAFKTEIDIGTIGFLVANSKFFKEFNKKNTFIRDNNVELIKEWEYTKINDATTPNYERIRSYEEKLAIPSFWHAIMADRRLFFGKYCKSKQHYAPRFSEEQMLKILEQALCQIDVFFKTKKPDIILSFGTSILGDYLIYLFAKYYNVPYLQIKATKVKNFISLHDTPIGISSHIIKSYNRNDFSERSKKEAISYINLVRSRGLQYEGAILSSRSRLFGRLKKAPLTLIKGLYGTIQIFKDSVIRNDCHLHDRFIPSLYHSLLNPLNSYYIEQRLLRNKKFLTMDNLGTVDEFIFFPLHFEPEVSIQIFGRPYQNQIELIRNLALSAPVGTKIVVKEHPRSIGFRPYSYYRKLLDIPNVYLIDPFIKAFKIVPHAKMVAVITGSIGLEAVIIGCPVLTFGEVAYNLLPDTMVGKVEALKYLGEKIRSLLENYEYNHGALIRYLSALIETSAPVDMYSILLNKKNRFNDNHGELSKEERRNQGYQNLSDFCLGEIKRCCH
ncbi:hypothetical protein [uncultured Desulfobacter sp.]|uniref:capsular polysaccharide export protein, LipB/KpsS family n=1 Tax=uncultured Desulfobacter sp. TaxID=240139 RepID=UPI0029F4EA48|nr:hypothetical protein [uncultured Desulfobacter sp.]